MPTPTHDCHASLGFPSSTQKGRPLDGGIPLQLLRVLEPIFADDSGFCVLRGIIELKKLGIYANGNIGLNTQAHFDGKDLRLLEGNDGRSALSCIRHERARLHHVLHCHGVCHLAKPCVFFPLGVTEVNVPRNNILLWTKPEGSD